MRFSDLDDRARDMTAGFALLLIVVASTILFHDDGS